MKRTYRHCFDVLISPFFCSFSVCNYLRCKSVTAWQQELLTANNVCFLKRKLNEVGGGRNSVRRTVNDADTKERTFLQNLIEHLKQFISDIKKLLNIYGSEDKTVKAAVATPISQLEYIADEFMRALTEAGKNKKPTTETGGVKKSLSDFDNESIKQQMRANIKKISAMEAVASIEFEDVSKKQLREKAVDEFKKFGYVVDRQNFGKITIGPDEIRDGTNYINTSGEKAALLCVPKVLKRGIVVGEHEHHKNRVHNTITIAAPVEINGDTVCVAVAVKRTSKNKYHAHRVLTFSGENFVLKEIKIDTEPTTPGMTAQNSGEGPSIGSVSNDSITQPASGVNKYSLSLDVKTKYSRQRISESWEDIRTLMYENDVHQDIIAEIEDYINKIRYRNLSRETAVTEGIIPKYEAILKVAR